MSDYKSLSGSAAENLFIELFSETFGAEKAGLLYSQYPFYDIYQNARYADFLCESGNKKIAIEIDDEASHNPRLVSKDKFTDDLLKQNSMTYLGWDVYRWTVRQLQKQPDTVKDELRLFLGDRAKLKEIDDYLPTQRGQAINGGNLQLREYQQQALENLKAMREKHETIALLFQATGTGKTVTAVLVAKSVGGKTLFVAHTMELVNQAYDAFKQLWSEASVGKYADSIKEVNSQVICGSVQSIALNLDDFAEDEFDYIIIDEAHHAAAETYQKILSYFKPKFILGLTATPERADDINILDIFKNTAHRLDIQTAVEIGALTDVRCIRIHTNIDMTKVRFNSVQYNIRDLDVKICVTERNKLIVDTWLSNVKDKRTVVFCASVKHAEQIAALFKEAGVEAVSVSGAMKTSERNEWLTKFADDKVKVLCACDLPGGLVLGKKGQRQAEDALYEKGERPDAVVDYPVDATDYEVVDIFNWQEEAAGMISQMEFVRRVDVQSETIEKYVRDGKIVPDLAVPMSEHRVFKYFKEDTVERYAEQFGWQLIDDKNRKDLFMKMVEEMDMSYSYKPVLLKAVFANAGKNGRIKIEDIVSYFKNYYEGRRVAGLIVEKSNSIFAKGGYTDKQAERNILSNPFKRFEDMNMMRHTKTLGVVEVDSTVWKKLTPQDIAIILAICDKKLDEYYGRIK